MAEYIDRSTFITEKREQYCRDCDRRKGIKNGKLRFCYEIGEAPCRSCGVDDALSDIEDYPAADVVEVVRCKDCVYYNSDCEECLDEMGYARAWQKNDYCSYGRKEGEG